MGKLVLVRHGQSQWNLENRFTGWVDVPITELGRQEALNAGKQLKALKFTRAFTSNLKRAHETLAIILKEIGQEGLPTEKSEALNERHYGDLQGLNKDETTAKHGAAQVKIWRRSYDVRPPNGESLKDTADRVLPYYREKIEPCVRAGETVLVSAHGNSLRALLMLLDGMTPEEILEVNIATGAPIIYEIDKTGKVLEKSPA